MYSLKADIQSANKSHSHIIQMDGTCTGINKANMANLTACVYHSVTCWEMNITVATILFIERGGGALKGKRAG